MCVSHVDKGTVRGESRPHLFYAELHLKNHYTGESVFPGGATLKHTHTTEEREVGGKLARMPSAIT